MNLKLIPGQLCQDAFIVWTWKNQPSGNLKRIQFGFPLTDYPWQKSSSLRTAEDDEINFKLIFRGVYEKNNSKLKFTQLQWLSYVAQSPLREMVVGTIRQEKIMVVASATSRCQPQHIWLKKTMILFVT